jgi:hypothetical protein
MRNSTVSSVTNFNSYNGATSAASGHSSLPDVRDPHAVLTRRQLRELNKISVKHNKFSSSRKQESLGEWFERLSNWETKGEFKNRKNREVIVRNVKRDQEEKMMATTGPTSSTSTTTGPTGPTTTSSTTTLTSTATGPTSTTATSTTSGGPSSTTATTTSGTGPGSTTATSTSTAEPTTDATSSTTTAEPTTDATSNTTTVNGVSSGGGSNNKTGMIAGITSGIAVLLLAAGTGAALLWRRSRRRGRVEQDTDAELGDREDDAVGVRQGFSADQRDIRSFPVVRGVGVRGERASSLPALPDSSLITGENVRGDDDSSSSHVGAELGRRSDSMASSLGFSS